MDEILEILEKDARTSPEEIAAMTGRDVEEVRGAIRSWEEKRVILRYKTVINRRLLESEGKTVRALIEVKVVPKKDVGFDDVAERIYRFPEVKSCTLLSGTYDLLLVVEGNDIHTVSDFVAEKLSPLEDVRGTVTHFLLKQYKEDGDILQPEKEGQKRLPISP